MTSDARPSPLRVHGVMFSVAVLFTANYIVSKLGMREISPLSFAWLRVAGAAAILALIAWHEGAPSLSRTDSRRVACYALLGVVINQTMFLSGLAFTTVQVAAILITSIPVFALATAIAMGKERPSPARIAGIALACAGALLVVGGEGFSGSGRSLLGAVMILINCFSYALYLVVSKPDMARLSPRTVVARMFLLGTLLMLPVSAHSLWHEEWRAISPAAWMALLAVIAGPTVAAYLLQAWALRHADSSVVAAYTYLQPVLATFFGWIFFQEQVRGLVLVAAAMIFSGVWMAGRSVPTETV